MEKGFLIIILIWIDFLLIFYKNKKKIIFFDISLQISIFLFIFSLLNLNFFNKSFIRLIQFFYYEELNYSSFGSYIIGFDGFSILFFCLTTFVIPTCILYTKDYILDYNYNFYLICIFSIQYFLLNAFWTFANVGIKQFLIFKCFFAFLKRNI